MKKVFVIFFVILLCSQLKAEPIKENVQDFFNEKIEKAPRKILSAQQRRTKLRRWQ